MERVNKQGKKRRTANGDGVGHIDDGGVALAISERVDKLGFLQSCALAVVKLRVFLALGGDVGRRTRWVHPEVGRAGIEDERHCLPRGSNLNVDDVRRAGFDVGHGLALNSAAGQARKPGDGMDGRMEIPFAAGNDGPWPGLGGRVRCGERRRWQHGGREEGGEHGDDVAVLRSDDVLRTGRWNTSTTR